LAAVLLNSFAGGLGVGFFGYFLQAAGVPRLRAVILSCVLGCSSAHLFFGSVPETYAFSALSLILVLFVALKWPGRVGAFVLPGLLAFGVLITNLCTVTMIFLGSLLPIRQVVA